MLATPGKKPLSPSSANYIDPTGFAAGANTFELYVTISPKATPFEGFGINRMTLHVATPR